MIWRERGLLTQDETIENFGGCLQDARLASLAVQQGESGTGLRRSPYDRLLERFDGMEGEPKSQLHPSQ